ncbi:Bro-N domain-containing protein, partial [Escherichia coli]|nr:Bro-N domain-containing protein [Escherichia coli]
MTATKSTSIFSFESQADIRVIVINGEPWFIASDVCRAIGIANHRDAVRKLDDDEKGVASTDTPGGEQESIIISESGLYTLILRCRDAV